MKTLPIKTTFLVLLSLSCRAAEGGDGGSDGGLSRWSLDVKQGLMRICSTALLGCSHMSRGASAIGCIEHSKKCGFVFSSCLQQKHRDASLTLILHVKLFKS